MGASNSNPTTGSGSTPNQPSWAGGPINSNFSPEAFGNRIGGDLGTLYGQGPKTFNQSLYAGLSDTTKSGLQQMLGMDSSDYMGGLAGAMSDYADTAMGNKLGIKDPGYMALRDKLQSDISGSVGASFANTGTYGSDSNVEALTGALSSGLGALDYQQYSDSLNRQNQALAALPGIYSAMLAPAQTQLGVGQAFDADAQAKLAAEYDLFNRQNGAGMDHIAKTLGILQGGSGEGGVINQPSNPLYDILGAGIGLAGIFL